MLLDNVYMENQSVQGVSVIKGDGTAPPENSAVIRNLRMINCFFLAGGTFPRVTGTCIDVDNIDVIDIEGMYVFRMRQPFLNITRTKNSQNVPGEIKNSIFTTDQDLSAEPTIYLLSGKIPNVHNCVWPGFSDGFYDTTNDILLFDPTVESNFPRQYTDIKGTTGIAKFGFGDTKVVTGITSGPYNITVSDSRTYYDLTHSIAGGLKVILPDTGEVNDGRLIIIKNNEASTSTGQFPYINVVNNSDQDTTIGRLSPGQAGLFVLDKQDSTKFKYVGRTFTDNLEFTDNHKITFGRGDPTGADLEIYQHSPSETFADNPAGVTNFIYTFDSPVVSDRIKVERKPENGSYSNVINFTVNLSTKTVVLGVATTLLEDIRISASESRIDTLAGLTLDGLTYPTTDGTSGQSIITDGSGNLTFGTAAGTGITAVVEDTTPQLGGDLESNGNDILFADNDKAIFGAGSDLLLFHNGSNSYIQEAGAGNLIIQADEFLVQNTAGNANYIRCQSSDESVQLRHGGATKFKTTSTGIDVTGTVTADSATIGGAVSVTGSLTTNQDITISETIPRLVLDDTSATDNLGIVRQANSNLVLEAQGGASTYGGIQFKRSNGTGTSVVDIEPDGDVAIYADNGTTKAFFWDAGESRLGLGTTSPDAKLDIATDSTDIALKLTNTQAETGGSTQYNVNMKTQYAEEQFTLHASDTYRGKAWIGFDRFGQEITFGTGASGTQKMVIAETGNVGIGSGFNPNAPLDIRASYAAIALTDTDGTDQRGDITQSGSVLLLGSRDGAANGEIKFVGKGNGGFDEYARFRTNGAFCVGTPSIGGEDGVTFNPEFSNGAAQQIFNRASTTDTSVVMRFRNGGSNVGSITHDSTSTSYITSSDQRLKDNIVDAPSASDDIDAIKVRSFDWKAGGSHQKYGMVAQELQGVAPDAVAEGDTEDDMMGVDYSKLVPMLVKEIQSLRARVAQLEGDN